MCRITGIITNELIDISLLLRMRDSMVHGGPDDAGIYLDQSNKIGLGQRRLSILDLSPAGHQPMVWEHLIIVYNGEIYNFKEVAIELKTFGYDFSSDSDTEVILKAFDCWGYDAVHRFRGMFAFAIWNTKTKKLLLCRDRVGVKPLYWYLKDGLFMFASELKAFHEHSMFDKSINQDAVSLYLQTGYIRSPLSIFQFAHKLEPGSFLEIDNSFNYNIWKYWDVRNIYSKVEKNLNNEKDQIAQCEKLLSESFQLRMVSDVPVGIFLSGGIDSSLVTALLQKESKIPLKTFTIGFEDTELNESVSAKAIADYLGTDHTELICTEAEFEKIIDQIPQYYDEPFGDSSCIPTFLVSKLAKEKVTVSLSADGGDEIFAGYNRYLYSETLFNKINRIPYFLRLIASQIISILNVSSIRAFLRFLPISNTYKKNLDARLPKLVQILKSKTKLDFIYASTLFITPENLKQLHLHDSNELVFNEIILKDNLIYSGFGVVDIESYLEGDILTKVDRATMQVALEGREPFLDHKIIEFAMALPDKMKIRNGITKWILREILYKYIPKSLMERPKMGFGIPLEKWLFSNLKPQLILLRKDKGFIDQFKLNDKELNRIVSSFLSGKAFSSHFVWYLFCLHQWYLKWIK
jgi:asparagine synthase (glutamine-hydrolysing)